MLHQEKAAFLVQFLYQLNICIAHSSFFHIHPYCEIAVLKYLISRSKRLLSVAALVSIIHGAGSVFLLAQISSALTAPESDRAEMALIFAATAVVVMLTYMGATILFQRLGQRSHAELRNFIAKRVLAADYRQLEVVGAARVQSALAEHCTQVAEFFESFPIILTNAVIVIGCLVYMAMLSWQVFLLALVVIGFGSLGYHLAHLRAIRHLTAAAEEQDRLFAYFRSLTDGAKELRLNRSKRTAFYEACWAARSKSCGRSELTECRCLLVGKLGEFSDLCVHRNGVIHAGRGRTRPGIDNDRICTCVCLYGGAVGSVAAQHSQGKPCAISGDRIDEITRAMTASEGRQTNTRSHRCSPCR